MTTWTHPFDHGLEEVRQARTGEEYLSFRITRWPSGITGGWTEPQPTTTYDVDLGLEHVAYRDSLEMARTSLSDLIEQAQQALAILNEEEGE